MARGASPRAQVKAVLGLGPIWAFVSIKKVHVNQDWFVFCPSSFCISEFSSGAKIPCSLTTVSVLEKASQETDWLVTALQCSELERGPPGRGGMDTRSPVAKQRRRANGAS